MDSNHSQLRTKFTVSLPYPNDFQFPILRRERYSNPPHSSYAYDSFLGTPLNKDPESSLCHFRKVFKGFYYLTIHSIPFRYVQDSLDRSNHPRKVSCTKVRLSTYPSTLRLRHRYSFHLFLRTRSLYPHSYVGVSLGT